MVAEQHQCTLLSLVYNLKAQLFAKILDQNDEKMNEKKNKVFDKTGEARKLRKMMSCSCVSGESRIHVVYGCEGKIWIL